MFFHARVLLCNSQSSIKSFTGRESPRGEVRAQYFRISSSRLRVSGLRPHSTSNAFIGVVFLVPVIILRVVFCMRSSFLGWSSELNSMPEHRSLIYCG